jgi:hypothetical protein
MPTRDVENETEVEFDFDDPEGGTNVCVTKVLGDRLREVDEDEELMIKGVTELLGDADNEVIVEPEDKDVFC